MFMITNKVVIVVGVVVGSGGVIDAVTTAAVVAVSPEICLEQANICSNLYSKQQEQHRGGNQQQKHFHKWSGLRRNPPSEKHTLKQIAHTD
ncbi:Hypothetical predicted protein [Octopus vulgaris]|uniref:Uncharacterized protein n=1 Tax=Octopus vulgaris TaxID=6645 RepID=A0AA36EZH0_OCTVU|nr:Hypothetical predicted protein [Octopus vulgaris]